MKKLLYLFLALLLPALIFVFLKYAGKNEFTIPVYYEEGVADPPVNCGQTYAKLYRLPDSVWKISEMVHGEANVMAFPKKGLDIEKSRLRIEDEFGRGQVWFRDACLLIGDSAKCNRWKKCTFLVKDPMQTVLFDKAGKIRGYYDLRLREEEDRLRVELKILLKKY